MNPHRHLPVTRPPIEQYATILPTHDLSDPPGHAAGPSMIQIISLLRAHWKRSLMVAAGVIVVAAIGIKLLPKTYTAVATLIVNQDNRDPLASREVPADMLVAYVATQTEIMLSPVILLPVVDRLHLTEDRDFAAGFNGSGASALRDYVERNLNATLEVTQGKGGQLLYVMANNKDAAKSAEIANTVADVYLEEEQRRINGPAGERARRYAEELAQLRAKAAEAQDKVGQYQQQHGITELSGGNTADTETQALDSLSQQLLNAQTARRALEAQSVGEGGNTDEALRSTPVQALKDQLSALQTQFAQMNTVFGPQHPKVLELQSKIAATQKALDTEVHSLGANNSVQLVRARQLEVKLNQSIADQRTKVLKLRQMQDDASKLMLELNSAQTVYKRALEGYDQVLFAAVGNGRNVSFISRATPPNKSAKPNKPKLLMMALFAGIVLGLIVPAGYEFLFNRRLRCRDDIERDFGIPVLAQFGAD